MTNRDRKSQWLVPFGFTLAGILFIVAAILPALKGRSLNAAFLGVGVIFLVLGLRLYFKPPAPPAGPDA